MSEPPIWTPGRRLAATLLAFHSAAVLAYALPDWTHLSAIPGPATWLELSALRQRWQMFTPANTENLAYLRFERTPPTGEVEVVMLRDHVSTWSPRRPRWIYLESALMNPRRRARWVPTALPALATELFGDAPGEVRVSKIAYPLPLLAPNANGNPLFTNGTDWNSAAARFESFPTIPLAKIDR